MLQQSIPTGRGLLTGAASCVDGAAIISSGGIVAGDDQAAPPAISPELARLIAEAESRNDAARAYDTFFDGERKRWQAAAANLPAGAGSAAHDRLRDQMGFKTVYAESTRLDDLTYEADMAVTRFPAATLPDLVAMLDHLERRGLADDRDCINMLSAGIRRIAGEGR
jgi:hypothetical protein